MKSQERVIIIQFLLVFVLLIKQDVASQEPVSEESQGSGATEYNAEDLEDPFKTEETELKPKQPEGPVEEKALPSLKIQGVVWGGGFPQTIINDKVLRVGDTIEEANIVNIARDSVVVSFEGKRYILPTPSTVEIQDIKKNPKGGKHEG